MKTKLLIIILCFSFSIAFSQNSDSVINSTQKQEVSKNIIGLDGGLLYLGFGGSINSSVNYERHIFSLKSTYSYLRIGVGYYLIGASDIGYAGVQVPLSLNLITGKSNNHFELNLGGRAIFDIKNDEIDYSDDPVMFSPIFNLGYRYQNPKGGFIFKSLIGLDGVTLGIGYAF